MNPNVNYGFGVIMICQYSSMDYSKCINVVQNVDSREDFECVGEQKHMRTLYFPFYFAMNLKLLYKIKSA